MVLELYRIKCTLHFSHNNSHDVTFATVSVHSGTPTWIVLKVFFHLRTSFLHSFLATTVCLSHASINRDAGAFGMSYILQQERVCANIVCDHRLKYSSLVT